MSATSDTSQFYTAYGYSYFEHCDLKFLLASLISEFFSCDRSNVDEEGMVTILAYATKHILECLFAILMVHLPSLDSFAGYSLFRNVLFVDNTNYEYLVVGE
jgi:hypothetical protein